MKVSTRKRLQALEQATSTHGIHQLVMLDVRTFSDVDREAYRAGDEGVLRRYGAPDRDKVSPAQIHTIVIDMHPASRDDKLSKTDLPEDALAED